MRILFATENVSSDVSRQNIRAGYKSRSMENRIKEFREEAGLSQEELGKVIDVNKAAMGKVEKRDPAAIELGKIVKLAQRLKKHPWELVSKERPPLDSGSDICYIGKYDVQASAGHGSLSETEAVIGRIGFQETWLRTLTTAPLGRLRIISACGDCMEPTISHGDDLLVDTGETIPRSNGIYIFLYQGEVLVKRAQIDTINNKITLSCDNKNYQSKEHPASRVKVSGRVLWIGRRV